MLRETMPIRSFHGNKFCTNKTNKKYLAKDFNNRCAYCNDLDSFSGGYRFYQVEHFAPKTKFPSLQYDYDNLLYACPWCNRAKWDTWPSDSPKTNIVGDIGFVDPCTSEYDKHLKRLPNGSIIGLTPLGKYMHKTLKLYLKRHEIIHNLTKLKQKIKDLQNNIELEKKANKDCSKKEQALMFIQNDFFKYFDLLEEISKEEQKD